MSGGGYSGNYGGGPGSGGYGMRGPRMMQARGDPMMWDNPMSGGADNFGQPQAPQFSAGGGEPLPGNAQPAMGQPPSNMMQDQLKSIGGYRVQPMTQVPSLGNAPRPYQDPQTGPMPQGSPLPMAPQQTPPWAAQNPMMWQMLNGGANPQWQQFNDARFNQYQSNPWMK